MKERLLLENGFYQTKHNMKAFLSIISQKAVVIFVYLGSWSFANENKDTGFYYPKEIKTMNFPND